MNALACRGTGLLLAVVFAFAPVAQAAQDSTATTDSRIEQILAQRDKVQDIPAVALSHDGQYLAWVVSHHDDTQLQLGSPSGKDVRTVATPDGCRVEDLRWAPRADTLAVLTRCRMDPGNTRPIHGAIWLLDATSGQPPHKLTDLDGFAGGMQWSTDGKQIAFLYVPGATRLAEATASGNPRVGVIGGENEQVQHVATVAISGGTPQLLTPQALFVYEFRLSPVGQRIAYTAAPPPGDDNWWTAKLYVQDASAGASPKTIVDPAAVTGSLHGLQIALPRWSPNAAQIFFIGGLMSDRGATGGDLYSVPASGGEPMDMTAGVKVTPSWFTFMGPRTLLVSQLASGKVQLAEYTIKGTSAAQTKTWFSVPGTIGNGRAALAVSIAHDRTPPRIAYAQSSFEHAPEVHSGVLGTMPPPVVTAINAGLQPGWGRPDPSNGTTTACRCRAGCCIRWTTIRTSVIR